VRKPFLIVLVPLATFALGWSLGGYPEAASQTKDKEPVKRARPLPKVEKGPPKAEKVSPAPKQETAPPKETPKEGNLYLWQVPEVGLQTLLVLKVTSGETFEAAYLVPVRMRLDGVVGKDKADLDRLDKLIGGRLVNTSMRGRDPTGQVLADIHFGAPRKDAPNDPSGWISDWLKKK
jgi:hypothetical protein